MPVSRFRRASIFARRLDSLLRLEARDLPAGFVFVEFGDNFPIVGINRTLTTTIDAFQNVANAPAQNDRIPGPTFTDSAGNSPLGTTVTATRPNYSAAARADAMAVLQRAFRPLDLTVVELKTAPQTLSDGRIVAGATSMADVITTLRAGNAGYRDAYVFCTKFVVDPGGPNQNALTGGGGTSPGGNTIGVTTDLSSATNSHDDVAVVYAGDNMTFNAMNNIAHEAGHCLGLRHAITNDANDANVNLFHVAEIMSYQNTNTTSSSMFTRYPMIRGDGNTPSSGTSPVNYNDIAARPSSRLTLFDQLAQDGNVLENLGFSFVSGTGLNDIIQITKSGSVANVSVTVYTTAAYTAGTEITVPFVGGTTFSYSIPLTKPILIYGGSQNDRVVINGDLGVSVEYDGMNGTDTLVVNGGGAASGTYSPDAVIATSVDVSFSGGVGTNGTSRGGVLTYGGTSIKFQNFEAASTFEVAGITALTVVTPNSNDTLTVDADASNRFRVGGTSGGVALVSVSADVAQLTVDTASKDAGSPNDSITLDMANVSVTVPARQITVNLGAGNDTARVNTVASGLGVTVNLGVGNDFVAVDSNGATAGGTVDAILGPVTVNGQGGADTLSLQDSSDATADKLTTTASQIGVTGDSFFGAGGAVAFTQLAAIDFSLSNALPGATVGLTPVVGTAISLSGRVDAMTVTLPVGPSDAFLEDDGVGGNTFNRLRSANGTFGNVVFVEPNVLAVQPGDPADSVTVNSLPDFDGTLTLGGVGARFAAAKFMGSLSLASGKTLSAFAGSAIQLGANLTLVSGALSLDSSAGMTQTGGVLNVNGALTVTTAGGQPAVFTTFGNNASTLLVTAGSIAHVNGSFTGTVQVSGTLGGTGVVGAVTVVAGGVIAPGVSPGKLTTSGVAFNSPSTLTVELNGPNAGADHDQLAVNGAVNLGGATLSPTVGFTPSPGQVFRIIDNDGSDTVSGTFATYAEGSTITVAGFDFLVSYIGGDGNDVTLTRTVVAPPPTVTAAALGVGGQRSMVTQLVVTFSDPVTYTGADAFKLTRTGTGGSTGDVSLTLNPPAGPTGAVTITFSGGLTADGSLIDGLYDFQIVASKVTGAGGALNGGADYTVTGSTANQWFRLFGDVNGDGFTDNVDLIAFRAANGSDSTMMNYDAAFDVNADGFIDNVDFIAFRQRLGVSP